VVALLPQRKPEVATQEFEQVQQHILFQILDSQIFMFILRIPAHHEQ